MRGATPMPEIITTEVFRLQELSDSAKDAARAWYRKDGPYDGWYDFVYEDFAAICEILGIELKTLPVRLYGGGTGQKPCIWFSGFWCQGDGACFEGRYRYKKAAIRNIRAHAPQDDELHRIALALQAIQRRHFYRLRAEIIHRGRYYHEYCMSIEVALDSSDVRGMIADAEDRVIELMRDLARWLYRQLEREYEYLTSDEVVDEAIIANDYTFTEDGRRFG